MPNLTNPKLNADKLNYSQHTAECKSYRVTSLCLEPNISPRFLTCHRKFDPIIQVHTINIIGNSNIHTSTHFVPVTQKNLPSFTLAILKVKTYKIHIAKAWLSVWQVRRIILLIAMPVAQHYILNYVNGNEKENDWKCSQSTHIFRTDFWLSSADRIHEHEVRVAGGTADIETGQLLIIKRCLCPVTFSNYNCLNISLSHSSAVFIHPYVTNHNKSTHSPQSQWTLHRTV